MIYELGVLLLVVMGEIEYLTSFLLAGKLLSCAIVGECLEISSISSTTNTTV